MTEYLCEEDMNTGEYISRDLALRQLNATCLATDCDNYNGVRCRACAYADAMDFIDAIPAADVQPVKHGRWECVGHDDTTYWYRCTVCGHEEHDNMTKHDNHCSSCGAIMDLKDGDAE